MIELVKLSEWARANGVSRQSATRWFHAGVLPAAAPQLVTGTILVDEATAPPAGVAICARVSSADQRGDLDRQVARLTAVATERRLPPTKVVAEVGSGLNGHGPSSSRCFVTRRWARSWSSTVTVWPRFGVEYLEAALVATGAQAVA